MITSSFFIWYKRSLVTAAALDDHILVFLENNIALVQEVQHGYRGQLGGRTTRFRYFSRTHQMHQGLDYRVIGRVHVSIQREIAFSAAVIRVISIRRNDPVLKNEHRS